MRVLGASTMKIFLGNLFSDFIAGGITRDTLVKVCVLIRIPEDKCNFPDINIVGPTLDVMFFGDFTLGTQPIVNIAALDVCFLLGFDFEKILIINLQGPAAAFAKLAVREGTNILLEGGALNKEIIRSGDLWRLTEPDQWLNDEIINSWCQLLEDPLKGRHRRWFIISTFFYPKLRDEGYKKGRLDKWFTPVRFLVFLNIQGN